MGFKPRELPGLARVDATGRAIATAGFSAAFLFDVASQFTNEPCADFAAPARWCQGIAIIAAFTVAGLRSRTVGATALGTRERRQALRFLIALDGAAALSVGAWMTRSTFDGCVPAASWPFILTLAGITLWAAAELGAEQGGRTSVSELVRGIGPGASFLAVSTDAISHVDFPSSWPRASYWLIAIAITALMSAAGLGVIATPRRRPRQITVDAIGSTLLLGSLAFRQGGEFTLPAGVGAHALLITATLLLLWNITGAVSRSRSDTAGLSPGRVVSPTR